MTVKYFKAIARQKDEKNYEVHIFKGYPSLAYARETLNGNGLKVNSIITVDENHYNQEKRNGALEWNRVK